MGARDRLRAYFEANVGKKLTKHELREVAGISEWARRIRELRDEEGMQVKTHNDRPDLKPGEYVLESLERVPAAARGISTQVRTEVLERDGYTCQLCGAGAGDRSAYNPSRKVRLHVDHIEPPTQGGSNEPENLRALCSDCNQGRSNIQAPSESATNLLIRIRRQPRSVQREVYEELKKRFEQ